MPGVTKDLTEADVLLEFQKVGSYVRVSAIDPITNTEVVVQGPADYSEISLRRTAVAKLNYVLRKKRTEADAAPPTNGTGRGGVIV